jgi:hypothetical protein
MIDLEVPVDGVALDAPDAFLSSDQSPPDSMMLSDLDGFLTAITIGPELIPGRSIECRVAVYANFRQSKIVFRMTRAASLRSSSAHLRFWAPCDRQNAARRPQRSTTPTLPPPRPSPVAPSQ